MCKRPASRHSRLFSAAEVKAKVDSEKVKLYEKLLKEKDKDKEEERQRTDKDREIKEKRIADLDARLENVRAELRDSEERPNKLHGTWVRENTIHSGENFHPDLFNERTRARELDLSCTSLCESSDDDETEGMYLPIGEAVPAAAE